MMLPNTNIYRVTARFPTKPADKYYRGLNILFGKLYENFTLPGFISDKCFYQLCVAMDNKANSLVDLSWDGTNAVEQGLGTLTFTPDVGWSGFAAGTYLVDGKYINSNLTQYGISASGSKFHMGVYITSAVSGSGSYLGCQRNTAPWYYNVINYTNTPSVTYYATDSIPYTHYPATPWAGSGWIGYNRIDSATMNYSDGTNYGQVANPQEYSNQTTPIIIGAKLTMPAGTVSSPTGNTIGGWALGRDMVARSKTPSAQVYKKIGDAIKAYLDSL